MKPQDIIFLLVFIIILFLRREKIAALLGIFCLIVAIPLFAKWIFFTAERLTWYAALCFFTAALFSLQNKKNI